MTSVCSRWCPRNLGYTNKRGAKKSTPGKPTLQVLRFPHAEIVYFVASERGGTRAALLCPNGISVLLVRWPSRHLSASLWACNFYYGFRLSSFSIFSFIVFSYNQASNRRAILGVNAQIKYVDPGHSEFYLATPHISVHRNVCGG